jgi:hypothetical protein
MSKMNDSARIALSEAVALRDSEEVLILTNPEEAVFSVANYCYSFS